MKGDIVYKMVTYQIIQTILQLLQHVVVFIGLFYYSGLPEYDRIF